MGKTVDLIDEEHIARFEIGEDGGQVAGSLDDRPRGGLDVDPQFGGDDVGKGGLAQARRAVEKDVIERFSPSPGGIDEDPQVVLGLFLPHILGECPGAQGGLKEDIVFGCFGGDDAGHKVSFSFKLCANSVKALYAAA